MIMDVIANKKVKINKGEWQIPSSTFNWTFTESGINEFEFEFVDVINFKSIDFSYTGNMSPSISLYYSHDTICYREFEFMSYVINDLSSIPDDLKEIVIRYEHRLLQLKSIYFNNTKQYVCVVYKENGNDIDDLSTNDITSFKKYIIEQKATPTSINLDYVFSYINLYSNEVRYLYDKKLKSIKMVLSDVYVPLKLDFIKIMSDEYIETFDQSISLISDTFFQAKYFQEYTFLPSLAKTFFDMLEDYKGT